MSLITPDDRAEAIAAEWVGVLKAVCSADDAAMPEALATARRLPSADREVLLVGLHTVYRKLLTRIEALEAQPKAMEWQGVWREGAPFERNDVVRCEGSTWICKQMTTAKPGTDDGQSWQMMLRRARDGRDARR